MLKYRKLTSTELTALEKEFVEYLVVNGLDSDRWKALNENDPEAAERVVELFSEVVFEGIMRKLKYLDFPGPDKLLAFQCLPEKMVLICLEAPRGSNLYNPDFYKLALSGKAEGVQVYTTHKPYSQVRELELYDMICKGCTISNDGALFKALCLAL